jgi:hypothetical protein
VAGGLRGAQLVGLAVLALCLAALPRLARRTGAPEVAHLDTAPAADVRQEAAP